MDITFAEILSTFVEKNINMCVARDKVYEHMGHAFQLLFFFLETFNVCSRDPKSIWALETCGISMAMLVYKGASAKKL